MAMSGKRLTTLEMPDEDMPPAPVAPSLERDMAPRTIPLPPIPPARRREIMVQLSIKVPLPLVERLEKLNSNTGAQKQQIIAAALDAYLGGHGY